MLSLDDSNLNPKLLGHLNLLGQREFQSDQWSNIRNSTEVAPFGAGMCVRRDVRDRLVYRSQEPTVGACLVPLEQGKIAYRETEI